VSRLQERIKELTDKCNAELDADRQKFEALLQDKNEQELEYEEKLKQVRGHLHLAAGALCWGLPSDCALYRMVCSCRQALCRARRLRTVPDVCKQYAPASLSARSKACMLGG
jgi:hypothetical protein